jgi:DNA-binding transcriptional LysR family regulator
MAMGTIQELAAIDDNHPMRGLAGLDLNLLTVFDAVMTERHVTRAAQRLSLTQSAVSNSLARLRTLLGDQLFLKAAQGVVPTAKAMELWPTVHHSLQALEQAIKPSAFDPAHSRRAFSVSLTDVVASLFMPRMLEDTARAAPHVVLKFIPQDDQMTIVRLVRGESDFEIAPNPPRLAALESVPLWSERFVMVARRGHPLLAEPLTIERLCECPHVIVNMCAQPEFAMAFDMALGAVGMSRFIKLSVNQFSIAAAALVMSDMVAVMPSHFVLQPFLGDQLAIRALPLSMPECRFHLSWHRRNNALSSHDWFKSLLMEIVGDLKLRLARLDIR